MSYSYVPHTARTTTARPPSSADALWQTGMAVGAALARHRMRLHDSREGLTSKDEQLASYGVRWSLDLAYETELARELGAARQQRFGGATAASLVGPPIVVSEAADDVVMERPALTWSASMGD